MKFSILFALLFLQAFCFGANRSLNLTAVTDPQQMTIKLKWQNNNTDINRFILQRSRDNNTWTDLYTIDSAQFNIDKIEKYTDQHPDGAQNYYRLKLITDKNNIEYSTAIRIIMGEANSSWIMFPVPVTSVLNLQYTGSDPIKGVISVFITNGNGRLLARTRNSSLSRNIEIPVSNLGKGIYDVRIMIGNETVFTQRFIKKSFYC